MEASLYSKIKYQAFMGISRKYYFRQLFFAGIFTAIFLWWMITKSPKFSLWWCPFYIITALIYPYSKFVYDTITDFLIGDNVIIYESGLFLIIKLVALTLCYGFAFLVAPIGLLMIYFMQKAQAEQLGEV